jgi:hypothetical protein
MLIGVTIVAVTVADAVSCARAVVAAHANANEATKSSRVLFICTFLDCYSKVFIA